MSQASQSDTAAWCPDPPAPPPQQDRRKLIGCTVGSVGHLRWRALLLTGLFRQLLIHHFSNPAFIEDPALKTEPLAAIWRDTLGTGIMIESAQRWRPELTEKRPAILVKRNPFRNMRIAINDLNGQDGQGFNHYLTLWVGSHTLFCVHGTGASCEILATEVQRELTQFGVVLGQQLGLLKFQVMEVGAISELEEATKNYVVPVTVAWAYEEKWKIEPDSLKLMGINLDLVPDLYQ